jgi:tetratricopeptide (TPR) repeat protein
MKQSFIVCFSLLLFIFNSCSDNKPVSAETPVSRRDTVKSDFLKQAERDPKNYITDCKTLYAEARKKDSILMTDLEADVKHANEAIKAFTDFAYYCKNDSLAPVFLIKTAMVARSIDNIPQAKIVLDKCIADYPDFRNLPEAIFLLAQLYDEPGYLNSEVEAQRLYKQILEEYPKSPIIPTVKGALKMIGKTDKELMEEIKKKNKS